MENIFGPIIVVCGRRDIGKSLLIRDILYSKRDIPLGVIMTGTEYANPFYSNFIPRHLIQHSYSETHLENIKYRQERIRQTKSKEGCSEIDSRAFIVLDDCMYDNAWTHSSLIREIFCNGRCWNIMLIIALPYPMSIPPLLRENIDYTFIFREHSIRHRRILHEMVESIFPTFEMFCQVLDNLTAEYGCMVVDNTVRSNALPDAVYWYKSSLDIPPFRMCTDADYEELIVE